LLSYLLLYNLEFNSDEKTLYFNYGFHGGDIYSLYQAPQPG